MTLTQMLSEPDPDWFTDAACGGLDSDLFFPVGEDPVAAATAKAVCGACPVREACLQYAIATNQTEGIWGGQTGEERRRLRRRLQRQLRKAS